MCIFAAVMFIKPTKKWRNPEGDSSIMVPYTYYRLCESERDAAGKSKQRTVLGLGELLEFPTEEERDELAELLTALIKEGEYRLCSSQRMYDAAQGFYGKWLDEKREAKEAKVCVKLKSLQPEMSRSVGGEHVCSQTLERLKLKGFLMRQGWPEDKARLIVIDASFSSAENLAWLRENGYDFITVMRSTGFAYEAVGEVRSVTDNKGRTIRLQKVRVQDMEDTVMLVDSDAKALKKLSMEAKLTRRYEEGLAKIKAGIDGKGCRPCLWRSLCARHRRTRTGCRGCRICCSRHRRPQ